MKSKLLILTLICSVNLTCLAQYEAADQILGDSWIEKVYTGKKYRSRDLQNVNRLCEKSINAACGLILNIQNGCHVYGLDLLDGVDLANQCHLNALLINVCLNDQELKMYLDAIRQDITSIKQLSADCQLKIRYLALTLLRPYPVLQNQKTEIGRLINCLGLDIDNSNADRYVKQLLESQLLNYAQHASGLCKLTRQRLSDARIDLLGIITQDSGLRSRCYTDQDHVWIIPKLIGMDIYIKNISCAMLLECRNSNGSVTYGIISPDLSLISPISEEINQDISVVVISGYSRSILNIHELQTINLKDMLYSIAAAWMQEYQADGLALTKRTPPYDQMLEYYLSIAKVDGITYDKSQTTSWMVIEHMYPDTLKHALATRK